MNHPSVLNGLINRNCPAYLTKIISSFLNDREIKISSKTPSHTKLIRKGTAQGSVLCPFHCNLAMDDCLNCNFPEKVKIMAFADDLTLFKTSSNIENRKIDLQEVCSTLIKWRDSRMLSLSLEKTQIISFSKKLYYPRKFNN